MKLILLTLALSAVAADLPPSCVKPVYCHSKLLHYVQMSQVFPDSKAFVDLQMKHDQYAILSEFEVLLNQTHNEPSKQHLQEFINAHFVVPTEMETWIPSDYQKNPAFLPGIKDLKLKQFAQDIHEIWPLLGRKIHPSVYEKPELYSIIPVHQGFIVPDGSCKEFYYWDSYWIVEGLLVSGMKDTVKGIISNLVQLQRQFGYVPYGNRYYFQERSQPPVLSAIMSLYIRATKDIEFLKANIDAIEGELEYWLDTKSIVFPVEGKEYSLLRYYSPSQGPRPEFYYDDFINAQVFDSEEVKTQFYVDVKSAAESGWAFSSRWLINEDGSNKGNFTHIRTSGIIPVDLNAIFANAMHHVASFHALLENGHRGAVWAHLAKQWKNSIQEVLWNEEDGIWYDWDLENSNHRKYFYPSNVAPLWMHVVMDHVWVKDNAHKIVDYLKKSQSLQFPGGVPASLVRSGEEWDFPNAWPPLVSIMVNALEVLETEESSKLAFQVAQNWVRATYKGFISNKQMYEKYDVEIPGKYTGHVSGQPGYGWSNGVVLEMLAKYGEKISIQDSHHTYKPSAVPTYLRYSPIPPKPVPPKH